MAPVTALREPPPSDATTAALPRTLSRDRLSVALGVGVWVALVGAGVMWGRAAVVGRGLGVNAAPLVGRWEWHAGRGLAVPIALAAVVVAFGPIVASRVRWSAVPLLAGASAGAWALALAASDGWDQVTRPLTTRHEYEPYAAGIDSPGDFLRDFLERLPDAPIHVQGHPPGAPLVPWTLDTVGLGGAGWFAAVVLAGWGLAVGASLVAARELAGEAAARRAAPALVLLPAAMWAGSSADALFAGVLAVGVAIAVAGGSSIAAGRRAAPALVLLPAALWAGTSADALFAGVLAVGVAIAVTGGSSIAADRRAAVGGGAVLGAGLLLTYGGAALLALPLFVHLQRRRPARAGLVLAGVAVVLVATAVLTGFWWLDGLDATRAAYLDGVASDRPSAYFALAGDPGALALALGPAVVVGLVLAIRRWRDAASLLPLVGLAIVVAVDASLLSKGEVERIWLPFVPWLALAAPGHRRSWLALQAVVAVVLQAWLRSKW